MSISSDPTSQGGSNESDLNRIKELASRGKFEVLMVWELSRLSSKGPGAILTLLQQFEAWAADGPRAMGEVWQESRPGEVVQLEYGEPIPLRGKDLATASGRVFG